MSLNGDFNGAPRWRVGPGRPGVRDALATLDPTEVAECRDLLNGAEVTVRTAEEIEGYGCTTVAELGAQRDLELWGCNPFEEVG